MYAKDLIGKTCIRERPVMIERFTQRDWLMFYGNRYEKTEEADYTYCTNPITIIGATDHNIVGEQVSVFADKPRRVILDERYCDDAWVDLDELVCPGIQEQTIQHFDTLHEHTDKE